MDKRITVGVTGASGSIYAARLLRILDDHPDLETVHLVVSKHARIAIEEELSLPAAGALDLERLIGRSPRRVRIEDDGAIGSRIASGSNPSLGMIVIPCSMGTLARLANGISDSLLTRAADVCLKERRPLILAVRETPLSTIHLRNMLAIAEAGATLLPAMPAFYQRPKTIDEMVDHFLGRVLDHVGLSSGLTRPWRPTGDQG